MDTPLTEIDRRYKEATDFLFAQLPMFSRVGAAAYKPGLDRSIALAGFFGNPQEKFRSIHIAGTNGKGSTSSLIASVLQSAGYKTALYTSPHLVDFRERMRINGKMIPKEKVIEFVERWKASDYSDRPSFFELTMMMAFDWFASENVDYAVIEVGMGGRLDSTNIIAPELSVITNISFDHTQFLGDSLSKIAGEKAGIMKPGVPVVVGEAEGEVEQVFRRRSSEIGAPIREAYREIDSEANESLGCPLAGSYQQKNINTARVAIDEMRRLGIKISDEDVARGFRDVEELTGLRGRWTVIRKRPLMVCDTGHNEAGLKYNLTQLEFLIEKNRSELKADQAARPTIRFVIGFVADKDVAHILPMFPKDAVYYVTQAAIPRAMPAEELRASCASLGLSARCYPSPAMGAEAALAEASPDDIIYIGGSTFVVADYLAETGR
ncbi:MAG: bifunctional folylpolyglutamate synthase/dihydrofolate synthase [Bacteroides sp.]|nr:bifunctional folylpolyglutamate synthase/dihydrofolate synthase [Bacteroides sp.]